MNLKPVLTALFILTVSNVNAAQTDKIISGYGYTIDGNTVKIGENTVRLLGSIAPKLDQMGQDVIGREYPAGLYARDVLASIIADQPLGCRVVPQNGKEKDAEGNYFGICAAAQVSDVSAEMIKRGWAMIDRSGETLVYRSYVEIETKSKRILRGIWQGPIEKPWEFEASKMIKTPENIKVIKENN